MKRVAILTFINTENYGALLQAYALSYICRNMGCTTHFLREQIAPLRGLRWVKNIVWTWVRSLLGYSKRRAKTKAFARKFLSVDECRDWNTLNRRYDKFIVGSDQVWNPFIIRNNMDFLLKNVTDNNKKIAYAASFALRDLPLEYKEVFSRYIGDFAHIGVREDAGLKILSNLGIERGVHNIDPTLLLTAHDWSQLCQDVTPSTPENYLLCYLMPGNKSNHLIIDYAKRLAHKHNLQLVIIGEREYKALFSTDYVVTAGPVEFVHYFAHASMVLTNSFHGTCFAINYQKPFWSFVWCNTVADNRNSRIESLLAMLGVASRLISVDASMQHIVNEKENEAIDFDNVHMLLDAKRNESLTYLTTAIHHANSVAN